MTDRFELSMMVGLRATSGSVAGALIGLGLIEQLPDRVRLTPRARLLGNLVFAEFLLDS